MHTVRRSSEVAAGAPEALSTEEVPAGLYSGAKAGLRPIHDKLLGELRQFGDFEEAPKKAYVGYRRKKQLAMIGPATNTRVDAELMSWMRRAYDAAG